MKGLIVYYSKYGASEEIAHLLQKGLEADCIKGDDYNNTLNDYDYIIIGCSVYAGMLNDQFKKFLQEHKHELLKKPLFLYHAGLTKDKEGIDKVYTENVDIEIKEHALYYDCLGGRLDFLKMNFFEKSIIKLLNKKANFVRKEQMHENVNLIDDERVKNFINKVKENI